MSAGPGAGLAEIWFYHLEKAGVEDTVAALAEKCLERSWRVLVRARALERIEALDAHLWVWRDGAFLPHGREDGADAARQPILLSLSRDDNPPANGAKAVILLEQAPAPRLEAVERVIQVFTGGDADSLASARADWTRLKAAGHKVSYWREGASGRWEQQG